MKAATAQKMTLNAQVQVGSIQTLIRRLHTFDAPDLVIVDEAHRAVASSYESILTHYPFARVLGLTATPCRLDGKGLKEAFGALVEGPSVESLITGGFLMRPVVYSASIPDLTGIKTRAITRWTNSPRLWNAPPSAATPSGLISGSRPAGPQSRSA